MAAHAGTHERGGNDPIRLDDLAEPQDNVDLNSNTLRHGLLPKLSGNSTDSLQGNGTWGSGGNATAADHFVTTQAESDLTNEFSLGSLTTGMLKHTVSAGVSTPATATAATDYVAPGAITTSGLTQATGKLLGRTTASTGAIEEITVGSGLSLAAGSLTASGSAGAKTLITETVTTGSASTVTFSSIANTYRDLEVVVRGRGNVSATSVIVRIQFNSDSGSNYDYAKFDANGGASGGGSGGQAVAQTSADFGYLTGNTGPSNAASSVSLTVFDYKGTTFTKNGRSNGNLTTANSVNNQFITSGFIAWRSTSAITRIDISLSSSTFVDGSVVSLYGVY